jgi:hypothetical protein
MALEMFSEIIESSFSEFTIENVILEFLLVF